MSEAITEGNSVQKLSEHLNNMPSKIDSKKVIKLNPIMLCSCCYQENCGGNCWYTIRFARWVKRVFKPLFRTILNYIKSYLKCFCIN